MNRDVPEKDVAWNACICCSKTCTYLSVLTVPSQMQVTHAFLTCHKLQSGWSFSSVTQSIQHDAHIFPKTTEKVDMSDQSTHFHFAGPQKLIVADIWLSLCIVESFICVCRCGNKLFTDNGFPKSGTHIIMSFKRSCRASMQWWLRDQRSHAFSVVIFLPLTHNVHFFPNHNTITCY